MKKMPVIIALILVLALSFSISISKPGKADDWTQTTQSDFDAGSKYYVDTISDPGNMTLAQHWQKYPTLPVLNEGPTLWDISGVTYPMVIKDGATYKMWYTGSDGSPIPPYKIGYATSSDGITWSKYGSNPIFGLGAPLSWEDTKVYMASVIYDGITYKMWYTGNNGPNDRIGYATSPDGISWTRFAGNPVLPLGFPGSWDDVGVRKPSVVYDGATYHMWYSGWNGVTWRIGYATSPDGTSWTKHAGNSCLGTSGVGCVFDLGLPGSWDDTGVFESGAYYDGSIFHLWYSGSDGSTGRTGYATSTDGVNWTRCPANPVVHEEPAGSWDDMHAYTPMVIYDSGLYHMWYSGRNATTYRIGYATSPDGITWTKIPTAFVMDTGTGWEETDVSSPTVLYDGATYHMWYSGQDSSADDRIGYANSSDGITWTKYAGNPVLTLGPGWDSRYVYCPTVIYEGGIYHMWFGGYNGLNARIGYANSTDMVTWTKYSGNPVLDLGSSGSFDDAHVSFPFVRFDGLTYHLWYSGSDGTNGRVGYATSPDGITWTRYPTNLCSGTSGDGCVLDIGPPGSWDSASAGDPFILHDGKMYRMWYSASNGNQRIGYAVSQDGIIWTKSEFNPVLNVTPPGYWDSDWSVYPTVIHDGTTYKMWFTGKNAMNDRKIGYAVMRYWSLGNFTSTVFDSGTNGTTWNFVNWTEYLPPGTNITIATRSGDSPVPDTSWSPWSAEMWDETGSAIQSPNSRYFQYRATLTTTDKYVTPILSEVNINYTASPIIPPTIEVWEPGGTPNQNYTQGDMITIKWFATDDSPLPPNPINITYGNTTVGWTTIATNEQNDGFYDWDTSTVPCPGTYWMNLSVYDSLGLTEFDEGNYSFNILCPDLPPMIETWEPGGTPGQNYTQGDTIMVTWNASDDKPLPANPINITYGNITVGWTTVATDEENDGSYDWATLNIPCPGTYWMNLSVYDSLGQTEFDEGNYSFNILCPDIPPTIETWEPGGTPGQTYTQGDTITVTWNASDDKPLPVNPINITYGNMTVGWTTIATDEENDSLYDWNTTTVPCPGTYWMNLSVYDSAGQETLDLGNFTFDIVCPDLPPTIEAWEPGGTSGQTYTQGDIVAVTWTAGDDNALPLNPINITYGDSSSGWTPIVTWTSNDGTYHWDTSSVPCPGTYMMNLSVYDSIGQITFDESNYSFEIECPTTHPPIIVEVEAEPIPQKIGEDLTVIATITDEDTDIVDLEVYINITKPDGTTLGNYSMSYNTVTDQFQYISDYELIGDYTFVIWAGDDDGNWDDEAGSFIIEGIPEEFNWKPLIALIFAIILILLGAYVSSTRPWRFTGDLRKDKQLTFMYSSVPFFLAEILTGIASLFITILRIPPVLGWGLIIDLLILIIGILIGILFYIKGEDPMTYEQEQPVPPIPPQIPEEYPGIPQAPPPPPEPPRKA